VLVEHAGLKPEISPSAYVAPNAIVSGQVSIGPRSRILFGAVITADGGPVEIGSDCIVMEHAIIRGRARYPALVGDRVLIGPHSHLHGVVVESDVFIATGVSAFPGSRLESGAEARINSIVHVNTRVTSGTSIPIGWIAIGDPAELFSPNQYDTYWPRLKALDYPRTVFGTPREDLTMERLTTIYVELFGDHQSDTLIDLATEWGGRGRQDPDHSL
jgi:gamma-carbonic anhydrase